MDISETVINGQTWNPVIPMSDNDKRIMTQIYTDSFQIVNFSSLYDYQLSEDEHGLNSDGTWDFIITTPIDTSSLVYDVPSLICMGLAGMFKCGNEYLVKFELYPNDIDCRIITISSVAIKLADLAKIICSVTKPTSYECSNDGVLTYAGYSIGA
ncbi:MAG: hypothetical protein ACYC0V_00560 [Armatimonadota bacterium]